jgi:two-component system, NarL family, response regulator YdfI
MISILIFCADAKLRRKLEQLVQQDLGIRVVGITDDHGSFVRLASRFYPNVVLTYGMPNDEAFTRWRVRHNNVAWVLVVDPENEGACFEALHAGVSAIVPPSADLAEITAIIRIVAGGQVVFPQEFVAKLSGKAEIVNGPSNETVVRRTSLSKREGAVLTAIADGLSNKEIARRLGISVHTVKFHVASILEKLKVDTRTEAVIKAAQLGLVML